jgi:hypothetical protein
MRQQTRKPQQAECTVQHRKNIVANPEQALYEDLAFKGTIMLYREFILNQLEINLHKIVEFAIKPLSKITSVN